MNAKQFKVNGRYRLQSCDSVYELIKIVPDPRPNHGDTGIFFRVEPPETPDNLSVPIRENLALAGRYFDAV